MKRVLEPLCEGAGQPPDEDYRCSVCGGRFYVTRGKDGKRWHGVVQKHLAMHALKSNPSANRRPLFESRTTVFAEAGLVEVQ
jgi:hypothetical protein